MFYKQNEVNKAITCPICSQIYQDPRFLSCCGEFACFRCIQDCADSSQEPEFECSLCQQKHAKSTVFPPVKALAKLIEAKADFVTQHPKVQELRSKLDELKREHDEFKQRLSNGLHEITEHCGKLRTQVDLETEKLIDQAHQFNEQFRAEIDQYQQSCIESFNSKISEFKSLADPFSSRILSCYDEKTAFLNGFNVDSSNTDGFVEEVANISQDLTTMNRSLNGLLFNKRKLEFDKNEQELTSTRGWSWRCTKCSSYRTLRSV
jgi:uncharacterized protein YhaN